MGLQLIRGAEDTSTVGRWTEANLQRSPIRFFSRGVLVNSGIVSETPSAHRHFGSLRYGCPPSEEGATLASHCASTNIWEFDPSRLLTNPEG